MSEEGRAYSSRRSDASRRRPWACQWCLRKREGGVSKVGTDQSGVVYRMTVVVNGPDV